MPLIGLTSLQRVLPQQPLSSVDITEKQLLSQQRQDYSESGQQLEEEVNRVYPL